MWSRDGVARALAAAASALDNAPQDTMTAAALAPEATAPAPDATPTSASFPALSWRPALMRARPPSLQAGTAAARETWRARGVRCAAAAGSSSTEHVNTSARASGAVASDAGGASSSSERSVRPRSSSSTCQGSFSLSDSQRIARSDSDDAESSDDDGKLLPGQSDTLREDSASGSSDELCGDVLYGAAAHSSHKRMCAEVEMRAAARSRRPSHAQYKEALLDSATIQQIVVGQHRCKHMWTDGDELVQCTHQLWARGVPAAITVLTKQREAFLVKGSKERGNDVFAALTFADATQLHGPTAWKPPVNKVVYKVGPTPEQQRVVCQEIFLAHYPVSRATLKRLVQRKRVGADAYPPLNALLRQHRTSNKTLLVISWWLAYAKQV